MDSDHQSSTNRPFGFIGYCPMIARLGQDRKKNVSIDVWCLGPATHSGRVPIHGIMVQCNVM